MTTSVLRVVGATIGVLVCVSCTHAAQTRLISTFLPPNPIVTYPDAAPHTETRLSSNGFGVTSGIEGRVLMIDSSSPSLVADNLAISYQGDLGVRGSIRATGDIAAVSRRATKTDVRVFEADPFRILAHTHIVTYRYRTDRKHADRRIGIVAEDAPAEVSGTRHDRFDVTNTLAVEIAATKALEKRLAALSRDVTSIENNAGTR